jgi:hypothetical protein
MSRRAGLTARPDLVVPFNEIAIQRQLWRVTLLLVIRAITAVLSILGLATVFLFMDYRQRPVPGVGG